MAKPLGLGEVRKYLYQALKVVMMDGSLDANALMRDLSVRWEAPLGAAFRREVERLYPTIGRPRGAVDKAPRRKPVKKQVANPTSLL